MLSTYNVTYMHVFRAHHLILDNQLVCSFLEDSIAHSPNSLVACCLSLKLPLPLPLSTDAILIQVLVKDGSSTVHF